MKDYVLAWECPYSGAVIHPDLLIGYGNPPRSPACPVGIGAGAPMKPVAIEIEGKPGTPDYTQKVLNGPPLLAIEAARNRTSIKPARTSIKPASNKGK